MGFFANVLPLFGRTVLPCIEDRNNGVGSRRRHQELFRPNFARLAAGSRPYGSSYSPEVAEIRIHGEARPSRNNGWKPTRRYYFPRALQLGTGWTGTTPEGKVPDGNTSQVSWR